MIEADAMRTRTTRHEKNERRKGNDNAFPDDVVEKKKTGIILKGACLDRDNLHSAVQLRNAVLKDLLSLLIFSTHEIE